MDSLRPDGGRVIPFPLRRDHEPWVTKRQLAGHLQVCERTIERWTTGGMPCLRRVGGRTVRYQASRCEAWLAGAEA
jgi:phage terminase Nu1 subunit (DNA packaging protein)